MVDLASVVQSTRITEVAIDALRPADSLRSAGVDAEHVQLLAQMDGNLPPICVHRETMRVVDGMHRLHAAMLRGDSTVDVVFFDGDETAALLLAVEANTTHGLPLTLADRQAAAERIIAACPAMSDRAIAATAGLSPKTIGAIRNRTSAGASQTDVRIGLDGRRRMVSGAEGRQAAQRILAESPNASLREVAKAAGISPNTVRRVRAQMSEESAGGRSIRVGRPRTSSVSTGGCKDLPVVLGELQRDPSLRLTETGRSLLRWLMAHRIEEREWQTVVGSVPPHCAEVVSEVARRYADSWRRLAEELADSTSATA
ncbi:ParB/RepB/Spo0J family partition protein [Kutzneria buriramensis]|uniref:ParB-like nuclease family protein n=1 Tax=Kutzneria buriramensis TaxID=1045776 RepID=A0A3E0H147_9PSEU|nr:ParB/RepB/Spo0J family partition protein [Kutzneria buriramensis]REH35770.1 ParB-like nuclease family protein [Kutzneria buriramensis]